MAAPITLESFDGDAPVFEQEHPDYKRGFEEGLLEAKHLAQSQLNNSVSELTSTLNDMAFGYAEAHQQILTQLKPLFTQLSDLIVPRVLEETFQLHLIDVLQNTVQTDSMQSFEILISSSNAELLEMSDFSVPGAVKISHSDDLIAGQAVIREGESTQILDLAELTDTLRTALLGIDQTEWRQSNG